MRGNAGWVLLPALMLLAGHAGAQCTKDTDCKGDRVCEAGKCTSPAPPVAPNDAAAPAPTPAPSSQAADAPGASVAPAPDAPAAPHAPSPDPDTPALAPRTATAPTPPPPATTLSPQPLALAPLTPTPLEPERPKTKRRSKTAMVSGIVMVSTGPIALLGALAAKSAQKRCDDDLQRDYPDRVLPTSERYRVDECNGYSVPVYLLGIGGAVLTAIGIPLIIYGAKSVPDDQLARRLELQPWASPTAGGMRLRLTL